MSKNYRQDPLIEEVLDDLEARFHGKIVSVFGLGSYFEDDLPSNWIKNDIDLVAIVESLEDIPKSLGIYYLSSSFPLNCLTFLSIFL